MFHNSFPSWSYGSSITVITRKKSIFKIPSVQRDRILHSEGFIYGSLRAGTVTRSQALTFLWRAFGAPEPTSRDCPFVDVDRKAFYYKAVLWGVEKGITNSTSKTTFSPDQNCSRAEIVTFLYAAFGRPSCNTYTRYADVKAGKWYDRPAAWARDNGIEVGENGSFHPRTDCARASTILYVYRALEGRALDYEKP